MDKKVVSIVVPCFNEQESVQLFYDEVSRYTGEIDADVELIFVDDGSKDNTLEVVKGLAYVDKRVKFISFSRNFGKEAAMYAGLQNSRGDYVVIMDADLQHPPKFLPEMYEKVSSGEYDCAATRRVSRDGEGKIRSFFSSAFYHVINKISHTHIEPDAQDYRFMSRKMVDAILSMQEHNRFSKGIFSWVGFSTYYIPYENVERVAGQTKWSFWGLIKYSMEGILAFSTAPLILSSILGMLICLIAFCMIIVVLVRTLLWGDPVAGFPTLICVILLLSGVQLFCMGILGQYFAKMYLEVKNRPQYISKEDNIHTKAE